MGLLFTALPSFGAGPTTVVEKYGRLCTVGNKVCDARGEPVVLRGMSLFWSQWMGKFYTAETVRWLRDDWKCTVVRAAMATGSKDGFNGAPEKTMAALRAVIKACVDTGIYVIIDFHSHNAHKETENALAFFDQVSKEFGAYPNVIYELFNEPQDVQWSTIIKPYAETVIPAIRRNDPSNLIIVGTRTWSQRVDEAAADPLAGPNIAYTMHFYAGTHKQSLRDQTARALAAGIPVFVTEYGTCGSSGNGKFDPAETAAWYEFLEANHISYCNWSVADKAETASILIPNLNKLSGWTDEELTESGKLVKGQLVKMNTPIFESLGK
ncbi:MAG: glycoside hydrolase family 5 protein [Spirochaetes bacterium]|nr:glycoside hydrolase family 5 protein [Spirochaetota bacterium]